MESETELDAWQAARDEALETTLAKSSYRVLCNGVGGGLGVLMPATTTADTMEQVDINRRAAVGAGVESPRPGFTITQQIGGGKA